MEMKEREYGDEREREKERAKGAQCILIISQRSLCIAAIGTQ